MDTTVKNKSPYKPKPIAELFPELGCMLSKDARQTLTSKKQPRRTIAHTLTAEKVIKPLSIAELKTAINALNIQSPKRNPQPNTASKKPNWNSSVKLKKTESHTAEKQLRHSSVRKVLSFQPKPMPVTKVRSTMTPSETPKFPKPESRAKKTLQLLGKSSVRISGISNIPPTPVTQNKIGKSQITLHQNNKENKPYVANINRKIFATPKNLMENKFKQSDLQTPVSNLSFKSNCDASFLLKEKEIDDIEERIRVLAEEATLENIAEVSPPISTPFKEYRNVQGFFNNTCINEKSYKDKTVISIDKVLENKEYGSRGESVIVSLCDILNKVADTNTYKTNTKLNDLFEVEKQTQHNIQLIEYVIQTLAHIKESQLKSLQYIRKLINEKKVHKPDVDVYATSQNVNIETPAKSPILRPSVIKTKSPSYKIPKKNMCLRKKIISKSMPNVSEDMQTPVKSKDKALNMYMQIKEKMNFLKTPLMKHRNLEPPDTPSLTSHNLQKQLDKLYNGT